MFVRFPGCASLSALPCLRRGASFSFPSYNWSRLHTTSAYCVIDNLQLAPGALQCRKYVPIKAFITSGQNLSLFLARITLFRLLPVLVTLRTRTQLLAHTYAGHRQLGGTAAGPLRDPEAGAAPCPPQRGYDRSRYERCAHHTHPLPRSFLQKNMW